MRFAVASQNFLTVTNHAGKTRRFLLFEADRGEPPRATGRLDLPPEMAIHVFNGEAHPLYTVDVIIAGSMGEGFVRRFAARGITAVATAEKDPRRAVAAYLDGTLPPPAPHRH